jgi:hypothetical protein
VQEADWGSFLLKQVMSYHPSDAEDDSMSRNGWWEWWEQNGNYVFGPALIAIAILSNKYIRTYWASHFMDDFIVAFVIAGILMITVDPFVKRMARREATRDIFHHMLGFKLPEIIRTRLQETVEETKLYREGTIQHIVMKEDDDSLVLDVELTFDVVNPTQHTLDFYPLVQFEKGERGDLKRIIHFGNLNYGKDAKLTESVGGLGALEYKGEGIPIASGGRETLKYEYSVKYPTSLGFYSPNFALPTIGMTLTIKHPENFKVLATKSDLAAPSGEWKYPNKLWMRGEHLEIVWEKIGSDKVSSML